MFIAFDFPTPFVAPAFIAFGVKGVEASALTAVGAALADMTVFFGIAGAILGVAAWTRGGEKIERIKARNGS